MLTGKYISSLEIVRNVIRDNNYHHEINWQDSIEWISEGLDLIGAPKAYQKKIAAITICNHRGTLPCDFHQIIQASGLSSECVQFPMRHTTNTFHPVFSCKKAACEPETVVNFTNPISTDEDGNPVFNFSNDQSTTLHKDLALGTGQDCPSDSTYELNDNFIFTSFKDGAKVLISYYSFPVDKDGFPLIPDNIKYKQAIQSYVRMKIDYQLWRQNSIERAVYEKSEQEWLWYVGAAGNAARIPSLDQMQSWQNMTLKLIRRLDEHNKYYESLGEVQKLTFGNPLGIN